LTHILTRQFVVMIIATVALFIYTDTTAQAQSCFAGFGDGPCDQNDDGCAKFGNTYLEICPHPTTGEWPIKGNEFTYVLTGDTQSQVCFALDGKITDFSPTTGGQHLNIGTGCPDGFAALLGMTVWEIDQAAGFFSAIFNHVPELRTVQHRQGNKASQSTILAPGPDQKRFEGILTGKTYTQSDGQTFTVETDEGGNLLSFEAFDPSGNPKTVRDVPPEGISLCIALSTFDSTCDPQHPDTTTCYKCDQANFPGNTNMRINDTCYGPLAPLGNYKCY
jgi:hypothetical protein